MSRLIDIDDSRNCYIGMDGEYEQWNIDPNVIAEAQPEIVRCKDCKHNPKLEWFDCPMAHMNEKQRPETAWCWKGERRTDEQV